jgi:hypothetical protein
MSQPRVFVSMSILAVLLGSGCAYRSSMVLTNPETRESIRCDRIEGLAVGPAAAAIQATRNAGYDQCIKNAKAAGFMISPPNMGIDFLLDDSNHVKAVRRDAERAGLRVGDRMLKIDGFDLSLPSGRRGYFEHLHSKRPGDIITVLIERDGNEMQLSMRIPVRDNP